MTGSYWVVSSARISSQRPNRTIMCCAMHCGAAAAALSIAVRHEREYPLGQTQESTTHDGAHGILNWSSEGKRALESLALEEIGISGEARRRRTHLIGMKASRKPAISSQNPTESESSSSSISLKRTTISCDIQESTEPAQNRSPHGRSRVFHRACSIAISSCQAPNISVESAFAALLGASSCGVHGTPRTCAANMAA